jgi:ABC-type transporter Mla subunit MlaD
MAIEDDIYALLQTVDGKVDDLAAQITALQAGNDTLASLAEQVSDLADQLTAVQGGNDTLASLSGQIDDIATTPPEAVNNFIAAMNANYGLDL